MIRTMLTSTFVFLVLSTPTFAQQCLHEGTESPEQATRRRAAIDAARAINTFQQNRPLQNGHKLFWPAARLALLSSDEVPTVGNPPVRLSFAPDSDLLPGWRLKLEVTTFSGYWFAISDRTDPCGFTVIGNAQGLIYSAHPLR
jgi:hypothetical protein